MNEYVIPTDKLLLGGHLALGTSVSIETASNLHGIDFPDTVKFAKTSIHENGISSDTYGRETGELWAIAGANSVEILKTLDLGGNSLSNVGGITLPQATLNNISITTSQVSSQNYNGQNLEHELDALTTAQNTILARTQGLTTNKIMKSNGSGILAVSSLTEANVNTLSGNETVSGNKTHSGDITISDLTASKLVLTDGNKKLVSGLAETDLFRLGVTSNQFVGADTATVFAMTQSSNESYATTFLRMSCGSSSATEMGLQITNNTQSLNFTDSINLKNLNGDAIIGQVKNDGINIVSGKTYQINGSQLNFNNLAGSVADNQLSSNIPLKNADTLQSKAGELVNTYRTVSNTNGDNTALVIDKRNTSGATIYSNDITAYNSGTFVFNTTATTGYRFNINGTNTLTIDENDVNIKAGMNYQIDGDDLNFSDLAGTASTGQIPSLASSKITSGTLDVARIPSLPASQLTSGTIADARLPTTLLKTTTAETIINTGATGGTNLHVRHSSNFQGNPSISVEDYNATGSQLQAGTLTLDSDDVAIKNSDSDGGVVFYNNNTTFLGRLDNTGMNIKSGLSYKVDGVALAVLSSSSQTINGFKTFSSGISSANQTTITGTCTLDANTTVSAGRTTALKATEVVGNLTTSSGNVDITGNVGIDGNLVMDTGHDITKTGDSAGGVFARLVSLETSYRLKHIAPNLVVSSSYVMYMKFWSLPMNSGYANNDMIMGQGHTTTPQTKKYNNHYQTVFDGTVGTDLTDFTRTQSSVSGSAYSIDITAPSSYYSPSGQTLTNLIINGTGYINWGHSSFPSSIRGKYNKMIRIGHYINDAVRITIDGQPIVWSKYTFSQSISGTGNDNFNSVCVVRGDVSAIEVIYMAGAGSNYLTLQFNVMGAWD